MTKEDKKARRKLRHQAQKAVTPNFMHRMGMVSTTGNIHAAVKQYVDRQLAGMRHAQRTMTVRPLVEGEQVPAAVGQ